MEYSVIIRTLGTAGNKYQQLLDSISQQAIQPKEILVYIAENYPIPKETINRERYITVPKGMVAQRALPFKEITTEYCLFLDDDVYLPPNAVSILYNTLIKHQADVISPALFFHKYRFISFITGNSFPHRNTQKGYLILPTGGFSFNENTEIKVKESQSNAGPCFFCKKETMLNIHFEEELWLDETGYALWDDQTMFYKMYLYGYKILTTFESGIIHLDAQSSTQIPEKVNKIIYADSRNRLIFWYKFIYSQQPNFYRKIYVALCIIYSYCMQLIMYTYVGFKNGNTARTSSFLKGIKAAVNYIKELRYKDIQ